MTDPAPRSTPRALFLGMAAVGLGLLAPVLLAEVVLRFLPVNDGLRAAPVNEASPVFRFAPNRRITWSRDWNFAMVNRTRINNAGYVNDQDYDAADPRPLCAIIGDSYVEASMVPFPETISGRVAQAFAPEVRVYSFAASGAPLSQYLIWAREARERFQAQRLAIVVVGNDWDESLAEYKVEPGFHHYVNAPDGSLMLRRFDYAPRRWRELVRTTALGRYLFFNLQVQQRLPRMLGSRPDVAMPVGARRDAGNSASFSDPKRLERSQAAVQAFLRDLQAFADWAPDEVVFVLDGVRYPEDAAAAPGSYFVRMRAIFAAEARAAGFEVVDMDEYFFEKFRADGERFEFPNDPHWNGHGHATAADALARSATLSRWRGGN
ncbi:MAG: hypothetical protein ACT4PE_09560 [Candidatus Eiseniibacteriota bacterium]